MEVLLRFNFNRSSTLGSGLSPFCLELCREADMCSAELSSLEDLDVNTEDNFCEENVGILFIVVDSASILLEPNEVSAACAFNL